MDWRLKAVCIAGRGREEEAAVTKLEWKAVLGYISKRECRQVVTRVRAHKRFFPAFASVCRSHHSVSEQAWFLINMWWGCAGWQVLKLEICMRTAICLLQTLFWFAGCDYMSVLVSTDRCANLQESGCWRHIFRQSVQAVVICCVFVSWLKDQHKKIRVDIIQLLRQLVLPCLSSCCKQQLTF